MISTTKLFNKPLTYYPSKLALHLINGAEKKITSDIDRRQFLTLGLLKKHKSKD